MESSSQHSGCDQAMASRGLRMTEQRRRVYDAVMALRNHPTAVEVFLRVKEDMPSISLATVYNCLETLADCGLVRHVHHDRAPSRYCPNLEEHGHFFCEQCGTVLDVPVPVRQLQGIELPTHAVVTAWEVSFRGLCPKCARPKASTKRKKST